MSKLHLKENPTLADLQQYVREMVAERGFKDDVLNKFLMLTEEVGEFAKAARRHTTSMSFAADSADQDLEGEAADVLLVLLGLCNLMNIDLEQALRNKEEKNKKRVWR